MIQRLQSIFLFIAFVLSMMFFFFPIGTIELENSVLLPVKFWGFSFINQESLQPDFLSGWAITILFVVIALINFITIFFFKHRKFQIKFCLFNIILQLGSIGIIFFFLYCCKQKAGVDFHTNILIIFPMVETILTFLAFRLILKDELLIKSVDRIR
ncbi:MAG: DUF4293 domain-containing protein [Bacteroidales bacterium]|jgi:hypothetical protein|nr:DUF4293 domain-containing protein [Bacteroidales bacterium]